MRHLLSGCLHGIHLFIGLFQVFLNLLKLCPVASLGCRFLLIPQSLYILLQTFQLALGLLVIEKILVVNVEVLSAIKNATFRFYSKSSI